MKKKFTESLTVENAKKLKEYFMILSTQPYIKKNEDYYKLMISAFEQDKSYQFIVDVFLLYNTYERHI